MDILKKLQLKYRIKAKISTNKKNKNHNRIPMILKVTALDAIKTE